MVTKQRKPTPDLFVLGGPFNARDRHFLGFFDPPPSPRRVHLNFYRTLSPLLVVSHAAAGAV